MIRARRRFRAPLSVQNPAFPSWYPEVGVCVEIALTDTVGDVLRAAGAESYSGNFPDDPCVAWSGAALLTIDDSPYLVVDGGGHGDGSWNGKTKVGPLDSDTPNGSIFLAASSSGAVETDGVYSDGRQAACHTYNNLAGVGSTLYAMRSDGYWSPPGNSSPAAYAFTSSGQTSLTQSPTTGQFGCAVPYNGNIYCIAGNSTFDKLRVYSISGNSWTEESGATIAFGNYVSGAIDTTRGAMLVIGSTAGGGIDGAYWPDLTDLSQRQTASIDAPTGNVYSLEYDPDRDAFVSYQSGSLTVRETSASALAAGSGTSWTTRTFTGTTPVASTSNGTYGRFRYVPSLKGYVVLPTANSSLYFMRSA